MNQDWIYHNSHEQQYRSPFGAVCCNEKVSLSLKIRSENFPTSVKLRLWRESQGEELIEMKLQSDSARTKVYNAEIEPTVTGVIWYYFIVNCWDITFYYGNSSGIGGIGEISKQPPSAYQLTVYKEGTTTPKWLKEAVIYQIFVDRFANGSQEGKVLSPKKGSLLHSHWDNCPYYVRDMKTSHIFAYDFFGGNLAGVIGKLQYLKELGITAIYFNPIFEAPSNHKYDTANYKKIDEMFGDNEEFERLCSQAKKMGISIILDGVFSHTGSDSIYFNRYGKYDSLGAYQSKESPYYKWYRFSEYPTKYEAWWGIDALPNVNELEPSYIDYIVDAPDSVIAYWMEKGVKGWRLDVADELPDKFIKCLAARVKAIDKEGAVIGEVWEDASRKVSYGKLREYFDGQELDSVMNYPFRSYAIDFMLGRNTARETNLLFKSLAENYPKHNFYAAMNIIGGHDVPRILTILGEAPNDTELSIAEQAYYKLPEDKRQVGINRLKLLVLWQMTFPRCALRILW